MGDILPGGVLGGDFDHGLAFCVTDMATLANVERVLITPLRREIADCKDILYMLTWARHQEQMCSHLIALQGRLAGIETRLAIAMSARRPAVA